MAPRDTENNAYAKFWGDKQRTLWYVMVFLEWSLTIDKVAQCDIVSLVCIVIGHKNSTDNCRGKLGFIPRELSGHY